MVSSITDTDNKNDELIFTGVGEISEFVIFGILNSKSAIPLPHVNSSCYVVSNDTTFVFPDKDPLNEIVFSIMSDLIVGS